MIGPHGHRIGERGAVKVTVLPGEASYNGTTRNGVTSNPYNQWNGSYKIEPSLDVFNLLNSKNFHRPEVTNLIFNFDGTVQSGAGDPRQMQVGVRLFW